MNLQKIALITGANKGIGCEISRQLGECGFQIVLTAREEKRGNDAADSLIKQGYDVKFILMDIANPKSIQSAADEFGKSFDVLDILVNNAAILLDPSNDILKMSYEIIKQTLLINTIGTILVTQSFLKFIPDKGRIINISSEAGSLNN